MRWRGLLVLALGIVGLVALANAARHLLLQQPLLASTRVTLEQSFVLNEPLRDDMIVLAETITLSAESRIEGDVALIGEVVEVDAPISGDLTVLADQLLIGPQASIEGNATLLTHEARIYGQIAGTLHVRGDALTLNPDAQISGSVFACTDALTDAREGSSPIRSCDESDLWSSTHMLESLRDPRIALPLLNVTVSGAAVALLCSALGSLALSGLSILAVVLFPRQISHIEEAIRTNPRRLGGTGVMLLLLAGGISFALALVVASVPPLGLVLVPVYVIAALFFFGMSLAGWITITLIIGDLILRRVSQAALPPLVIVAVGNLSLLLGWNLLVMNPYTRLIGLSVVLLLGMIGLGAAAITRVGTRPVHRSYLVQG